MFCPSGQGAERFRALFKFNICNIADILSVTCDDRIDELHMNGCQPPITGNVESWSTANTATIGGTVRLLAIKCFDTGGLGWNTCFDNKWPGL